MAKKIIPTILLLAIIFSCLTKDPTQEELGLKISVSTDKLKYEPGEEIEITFSNEGAASARVMEGLIQEKEGVNYDRVLLFWVKVLNPNKVWTIDLPYSEQDGAAFPIHLRPARTRKYTSEHMTTKYAGRKIKIGLAFGDIANDHTFEAVSSIIEISNKEEK